MCILKWYTLLTKARAGDHRMAMVALFRSLRYNSSHLNCVLSATQS